MLGFRRKKSQKFSLSLSVQTKNYSKFESKITQKYENTKQIGIKREKRSFVRIYTKNM